MTITGTASPPFVIDELLTRLRAADELEGVLIRWGLLSTLPTDRERLYILGTAAYAREHLGGAYAVRRESYFIRGLLEVSLITTDPTEVTHRLWSLIDATDQTLLADRDFTHATYTGEFRVMSDDVTPTSEGWFAQALFHIEMDHQR